MANQFRITNYNVTAGGIVLTVDFKRAEDTEAISNSIENIAYSTGSTRDSIIANLRARANAKINIYENDLAVKSVIEANMNRWIDVPEPE